MNDIVVGVDQSPTAREAAMTAASLAADMGSNLHIVTCLSRGSSREVQVGSDHFYLDSVSEAETFLADLGRSLRMTRSRPRSARATLRPPCAKKRPASMPG